MTRDEQKTWLLQWQRARAALDRMRTRELAGMSDEAALRAADALLSLARPEALDETRRSSSGLVPQQRAFHPRITRTKP